MKKIEKPKGREYQPLDFGRVKTYPLKDRPSKVSVNALARAWRAGGSFQSFLESLPGILASKDLRGLAQAIVAAKGKGKPVILGMGAHVIKVGLSPVVIDLMERGIITALATHGAAAVHDFELSFAGFTSEEVEAALEKGEFGMAEETGRIINEAVREGIPKGWGLGRALGEKILELGPEYLDKSLFAAGARLGLPVTVHVAVGTDIFHMHPACNGASLGDATYRDFRLLASVVAELGGGGVYLNVGSAVLLPEVFLKALTVARNLGHEVKDFVTANLDFIQHYRPLQNVVKRPVAAGGKGYALTGHHEIMVPLLAAAVIEELEGLRA